MGDNFAANLKLVERFAEIAANKACTRAQLCLAWLLAQGDGIAPIPGTKRVSYLEDDMAAAAVDLSDDELQQLDTLFAPANIAGHRYPPALLKSIDQS
jgi:aryl-alcohol dehydrogenase-like predicted oxidoreductase